MCNVLFTATQPKHSFVYRFTLVYDIWIGFVLYLVLIWVWKRHIKVLIRISLIENSCPSLTAINLLVRPVVVVKYHAHLLLTIDRFYLLSRRSFAINLKLCSDVDKLVFHQLRGMHKLYRYLADGSNTHFLLSFCCHFSSFFFEQSVQLFSHKLLFEQTISHDRITRHTNAMHTKKLHKTRKYVNKV